VKARQRLTDLRMLVSSNKNTVVQARAESFLQEAGHLTETVGSSNGKTTLQCLGVTSQAPSSQIISGLKPYFKVWLIFISC
jgi:hypothetical protein